jgi:hypothetical protein
MHIFAIGASREGNIGHFASLQLLEKGNSVTFLVRSDRFKSDPQIKPFIESGKAHVVIGDAHKSEDVKRAFDECTRIAPIDYVLFGVGGTPNFTLSNGIVLDPHDICTRAMAIILANYPMINPPRLIVISSTGLGKKSHEALPMVWKPIYGWLLDGPHKDKLGMERLLYHATNRQWTEDEPLPHILAPGWEAKLPAERGWLKAVIVRPAWLTDGKEKGSSKYRISDGEIPSAYVISRRDLAHSIVNAVIPKWDTYVGKTINVAY